ncbi:MAG: sensor histidine kinase [Gemmatimonadota bacterium]
MTEPSNQPPEAAQGRTASAGQAVGRMAAAVADLARSHAPGAKRAAARFGDWLARIGWGKFILLSILLLILGGIATSLFLERSPAVVIEQGDPSDRVNVVVSVTPDGIKIAPPAVPTPPAPPTPPDVDKKGAGSNTRPKGAANVDVDSKGVRILTEKDGKRVAVVIDGKGVRIEDAAPAAAGGDSAAAEGVTIPPQDLHDAERAAAAVEAARARVEQIVSEQINRQVAKRTRAYQQHRSDWIMTFILLLITTMIIVKVVLGSKRKAETRAQAATATAAEESLKRQLAEAQLKMMQAQVEPHFLFNTLASVDYLIETDPARASTMQKNLIQYLRAALPQMREGSTTLGKEIALCRAYLEILRVRMEDRLQYAITVPQGLASAKFPPMMLQSLVENSIKHGLEPKAEGGTLTISADIANGNLRVTVADTGLGFAVGTRPGTGVGLSNLYERLAALYAGAAKLTIEANTPSGTISTIEVPYAVDMADQPAAAPAAQPA